VTTPVPGVGTAAGTAPKAQSSMDVANKDMFMKLLVAQMKYQNPMSPTEGNEYMNQMAMFTQVEKLTQLVEAQQAAQAWQQRLSAEGLVGKLVTGTAADSTLSDGSTIAVGEISTVEQPH
jgi:flagellar basal-body rod modification protein FlgD